MLGPVASTPVAAAPLASAAASTGTTQVAPGYTFFPPGLKVPWQRFPVQGRMADAHPPPPVVNTAQSYMPGYTVVPRGFPPGPWKHSTDPLLALQQKAPVPPPPPTVVTPGYTFTPPGMFAPYGQLVHPVTPLPLISPPVLPAGAAQTLPGYTLMPPGLIGPWRAIAVAPSPTPPGNNPTPPPPPHPPFPSHNLPFLPRLPQEDEERRLKRITEKLSILYNSLFGQGALTQTGPTSFIMRGGGWVMPRDPTATDDMSIGVLVGVSWVNTGSGRVWFNVSNAVNSAVWRGPF
jgi:hypothetical protein